MFGVDAKTWRAATVHLSLLSPPRRPRKCFLMFECVVVPCSIVEAAVSETVDDEITSEVEMDYSFDLPHDHRALHDRLAIGDTEEICFSETGKKGLRAHCIRVCTRRCSEVPRNVSPE